MTAGRGITHSERTPPELRSIRSKLFGIQSWVALSANDEETKPDFVHYGAHDLPVLDDEGKVVRVIAGSMLGASSPVKTSSPMFYADISLSAGASVPLDPLYDERAVYTVAGEVEIAGDVFGPAQLLVFRPGDRITIRAKTDARFMALGGDQWTAPDISGGISCLREKIASSRPKLTGRWRDSTLSLEIRSYPTSSHLEMKSGTFQLTLVANRRAGSLRPLEEGAHRFDRGRGLLLHSQWPELGITTPVTSVATKRISSAWAVPNDFSAPMASTGIFSLPPSTKALLSIASC